MYVHIFTFSYFRPSHRLHFVGSKTNPALSIPDKMSWTHKSRSGWSLDSYLKSILTHKPFIFKKEPPILRTLLERLLNLRRSHVLQSKRAVDTVYDLRTFHETRSNRGKLATPSQTLVPFLLCGY